MKAEFVGIEMTNLGVDNVEYFVAGDGEAGIDDLNTFFFQNADNITKEEVPCDATDEHHLQTITHLPHLHQRQPQAEHHSTAHPSV